jgi:hypothetical protein
MDKHWMTFFLIGKFNQASITTSKVKPSIFWNYLIILTINLLSNMFCRLLCIWFYVLRIEAGMDEFSFLNYRVAMYLFFSLMVLSHSIR